MPQRVLLSYKKGKVIEGDLMLKIEPVRSSDRINQKKLKKLLTEEMKFSILNKLLFEAANISKGFEKS